LSQTILIFHSSLLQRNPDYREIGVSRLTLRQGSKGSSYVERTFGRAEDLSDKFPARIRLLARPYFFVSIHTRESSILEHSVKLSLFLSHRCSSSAGRRASAHICPCWCVQGRSARRSRTVESFVREKRRGRLEWAYGGATYPKRRPERSWSLNVDVRSLYLRQILRVLGQTPGKISPSQMIARRKNHL